MGAAIRDRKPPVAIGPTSLSRTNTPPSAKHPTASTAHAIAPPLARPPTARCRCCIIMSPSSCLPLLLTPTAARPQAAGARIQPGDIPHHQHHNSDIDNMRYIDSWNASRMGAGRQ